MRIGRLLTVIAIAAAALAPLAATAHAQAVTVSCGQTIRSDTIVGNDLTNCPGDGLRIGADAITIDLDGHTIDGDGPVSGEGDGDVGIANGYSPNGGDLPSFDAVTVRNGTIRQFEVGVSFYSPTAGLRAD